MEDTIYDLLKEIPEAKNSLEYQDYTKNKTIGNASELISRAAETGLGYAVDLGKAKNLVDYVANRPGVDRVGKHGLFSASPTVDIQVNCRLIKENSSRVGNYLKSILSSGILNVMDFARSTNV